MKRNMMLLLSACLLLVVFCLAACGSKEPAETTSAAETTEAATKAAKSYKGKKYSYEGTDYAIKTADLPADYALIPHERFAASFKALTDGTITTKSTYGEVAQVFGEDGIKMTGIKYDGYAYYSWYSDKDYSSDVKVHVLVTFKDNGKKLTYYAFSSEGITAENVKP